MATIYNPKRPSWPPGLGASDGGESELCHVFPQFVKGLHILINDCSPHRSEERVFPCQLSQQIHIKQSWQSDHLLFVLSNQRLVIVDGINPHAKYFSSSGPSRHPLPPALIKELSEGPLRILTSSNSETFSRMSLPGNVSGTYLINTARVIHRANCR